MPDSDPAETDREADGPPDDETPVAPEDRCDYCQLAIPSDPVTEAYDGTTYHFCSEPCRETLAEEHRVFTRYHGARRFDPGVSALRAGLPEGIPRNSFVLVSGEPGTRAEALQGELVWRALQRGEPALVVAFLDTPVSVVQEFIGLGWNVLPYLASGQLRLLDCFTYRLDDPEAMEHSMNDWTEHLHRVAGSSTDTVRDPSNPQAVLNALERCLERCVDGDRQEGVVAIDSLTEFGSLVQPVQAYNFVKDLRASVCKAQTIPVFAGASRVGNGDDFPHDLGYVADGVIDLALSEELVEDTLMKRIRVRKMSGVLSIRRWATYEFAESEGLVAAGSGDDEDAAEESGDGGDTEDAGEETQPDTGDDVAATPEDRDPNGDAATTDPGGHGDATADATDAEDR